MKASGGLGARPRFQGKEQFVSSTGGTCNSTAGGVVDGVQKMCAGGDDGNSGAGWWVRGSEYLGRRVRRAVYHEESGDIIGAAG